MKAPQKMSASELTVWLADWLSIRGPASAGLDLRRDEAPYEYPLRLWKTAKVKFHNEFIRAVLALVENAADGLWEPVPFDQLVRLIEAGKIYEAMAALEIIARSRKLLTVQYGAQLRMQALRTLLSLGWIGSIEFWQAQSKEICDRWPGLIFKGLASHSIEVAFSHLPQLVVDSAAMRQILDIFPGLMRAQRLPLYNLKELSRNIIEKLSPESATLLREWFALRNDHLPIAMNIIHGSLKHALAQSLGGDVVPRTFVAALVENDEPELEYACI